MDKNIPQIRFRGFEEQWVEKELQSIADYKSSGLKASDAKPNGKYTLYDANGEIGKTDTYVSNTPYISIIKDGSGVGRVRKLPAQTNCIGTMGCISALSNNDIDFIFQYLKIKDFSEHIISGAIPHVYFSEYGKDTLHVPSLPEQEKIGELFRNLDNLIDEEQKRLDKLRALKAALLQKMFPSDNPDNTLNGGGNSLIINNLQKYDLVITPHPASNTPAIRFRGYTEPWQQKRLGDMGTFTKGYGYSKSDLAKNGTPIILYGLLYTNYETNIHNVKTYAKLQDNAVISKGNEVIIPASGETAEDIARASVIWDKGVILGGDLNVILPNSYIHSSFLALEITYGNTHTQLVRKAQGISVVHIHNADIMDIEISFPSLSEQQQIGNFFRTQDEQIAHTAQYITSLRTIRTALLQKMFV